MGTRHLLARPDVWPDQTSPNDYGIGALERACKVLGYEECDDDRWEPGFEKVALYGYGFFYTHAARQLPTGKRTSKAGCVERSESHQLIRRGGVTRCARHTLRMLSCLTIRLVLKFSIENPSHPG